MSTAPALTQFGRYRVVRELGRGAMGVVYEAEDESLLRHVAVKAMLLADDPEERALHEARFRQEGKAAGSLSHPNIVTIYDMGREGDWLYIAMELVHGEELRSQMNRGPLPLRAALKIVSQVASALAAAHARGIVHRDVKPANIMVLPGDKAKIMDFGVARMQASEVKTQTGMMLGSPKYMAPEQVEGHGVDHRSDIFSLGSVLYEAVAGVAPFQGKDIGALLMDIMRADPPSPGRFNAAIPPELDRVILKALRRSRDERYQDAQQLADDLEACARLLADGTEPESTTFSGSASLAATIAKANSEATTVARPPSGLRVAAGFDASKALQRIAAEAQRTAPPAKPAVDWRWGAAFAAAVVAAAWIAAG